MSKDDEARELVPLLRFPEFRGTDAWKFRPLQALGSRVTERNSDESVTRVLTNSAEHGVLDQRDFFEKDIAVAGRLDNYFVVEEGDYVYNPRISRAAPVGPISRNSVGRGVMSPLYTVFRLGEDGTDFHEHYFATNGWHNYLRSVSSTGARHDRMSIGIGDFMKMPIPLPPPAEQRKIADCLGSLDELIGAEREALAALRRHKTALMQHLFPRPGESRPRLRFPEFRDAGEWKETPLHAMANYQNGKAYEKDIVETGRFIVVNARFVSTDGSVRKFTDAEYCTATSGDILMALSDLPNGRALAKCFLVDRDDRYAVNQRVARLTPTTVVPSFLYFLLNRNPRLLIYDDGITQTHLSKGNVSDCRFPVPEDQAEQKCIAACLSSLDAQISAQDHKLAALRDHKRGLMQQLFPAPDDRP